MTTPTPTPDASPTEPVDTGSAAATAHQRVRQGRTAGLSPGALVHIGERRMDAPRLTVYEYDDNVISIRELKSIDNAPEQCREYKERKTVVWINVDGIHDATFIEDLGKRFGLHPLVLEDVMNVGQRPKLEEYDDCFFCVLKMLDVDDDEGQVMIEQISIVIGKGFVLTFQERSGDVFDGVRERIKSHKGKLRKMGADYLAYALIDAVVDNYFVALDVMTEFVDDIEQRLQDDAAKVNAKEIYTLKRELLYLRRSLFPAREVLGQLARHDESEIIGDTVDVYFRDVHDHVLQVTDSLETTREMMVSMLDMYHSAQANRLNEVMRVLTVISTFFIPLTFVAGIYGMNFDNMPELHQTYGYYGCLVLMAVVGVGMLVYMKRKRWL